VLPVPVAEQGHVHHVNPVAQGDPYLRTGIVRAFDGTGHLPIGDDFRIELFQHRLEMVDAFGFFQKLLGVPMLGDDLDTVAGAGLDGVFEPLEEKFAIADPGAAGTLHTDGRLQILGISFERTEPFQHLLVEAGAIVAHTLAVIFKELFDFKGSIPACALSSIDDHRKSPPGLNA